MNTRKISLFILICIFLISAIYFLSWPIKGLGDTDLWYHLNGGRFFWDHFKPADFGFFSFIAEGRTWSNYYWLHQAAVYKIFSLWGYQGLICFRTIFYLATQLLIAVFLLKNEKRDNLIIYFSIISVFCFFCLIPRCFSSVRPHIFSYFFIVAFIYLLENRSRRMILLPLLAIFWSNLHGIEYPVMMLICGSYLAEDFLKRFHAGTSFTSMQIFQLIMMVSAMWAVLVNPYGFKLLQAPFIISPNQHQYILELKHPVFEHFFDFRLVPIDSVFATLSNVLLMMALLAVIVGAVRRRIRVSHIIMFVGGIFLFFRADRFRYEAVLLALPLLKAHPLLPDLLFHQPISRFFRAFFSLCLIVLSILFFRSAFSNRPFYPFSTNRLPEGIAVFLNHVDTGGTILNIPTHGGYFQWRLGEKYKIFMDLEMLLFTDEDYYLASNAFLDKEVLTKFISYCRPDYISPLLKNQKFKKMISGFPNYKLVFFDDMEVLYVDKTQYPEVARLYELTNLDPFSASKTDINKLDNAKAEAVGGELLKMQAIYPNGNFANQMLALLARRVGEIDQVFHHADIIITNYPELPQGYLLYADQHMISGSFDKAIPFYLKALNRLKTEKKSDVQKKLAFCYQEIGKFKKAYKFMKQAINPFSPDTDLSDLIRLGKLAQKVGRISEAETCSKLAVIKTPIGDVSAMEYIRQQFSGLDAQ